MRAKTRLYLTAGGALVGETYRTGTTLYCKPGDVISAADQVTYKTTFEALGWTTEKATIESPVNVMSVHVAHDDATASAELILPARSLLLDVFVECTEAAAGSPDVDFGELGGDTDGILDGLGTATICDTVTGQVDTAPDFKGRGELLTSTVNEAAFRTKVMKFYPTGKTLANKKNSAGTAGEWTIHIMYVILPEVEA